MPSKKRTRKKGGISEREFIIGFFVLLAWVGISVLLILEGDALTSLTWVPTRLTQSVIPIGAVLFIIAESMSLPELWRMVKSANGISAHDTVEISEENHNNFDTSKEELNK